MLGELKIKVVSAVLKEDLDLLTKMDPYAIFILGSQKFSTHVANNQGMFPEWGDEFTFFVSDDEKLEIVLYDQDILVDDFIGSGFMSIYKLAERENIVKQLPLYKQGKDAGTIKFEMYFTSVSTAPRN